MRPLAHGTIVDVLVLYSGSRIGRKMLKRSPEGIFVLKRGMPDGNHSKERLGLMSAPIRVVGSSGETAKGVFYMLRSGRGRTGKGRFEKRVEGLLAEGACDNQILQHRPASPGGS